MNKVQNDPAPLPPSIHLSAARLVSDNAQLFLKKEKSLRSRSARRWARLDGWRGGADSEEWAERHSSWYLSISCWSITRCMSSCGPRDTASEGSGGAELNGQITGGVLMAVTMNKVKRTQWEEPQLKLRLAVSCGVV